MSTSILDVETEKKCTVNEVNDVKSTKVIALREYNNKTKEFIIRLLLTENMYQKPLSQKTQEMFMKLQDK